MIPSLIDVSKYVFLLLEIHFLSERATDLPLFEVCTDYTTSNTFSI